MSSSKDNARVLFVHSSLSSFVQADLEILQRNFDVQKVNISTKRSLILLGLPKLLKGVQRADVVFCWFADVNAFFSVLFSFFFRKKTLIVVGGVDAAYVPEIGYGVFVNRRRAIMSKFVYKYATKIIAVDASLKQDILKNSRLEIGNKIEVSPTGYDNNKFVLIDNKKENLVLTVSGVNWSNIKRKGLETFVKSASVLPEVKFVLAGKFLDESINYLKSIATANVYFTGFLTDKELITLYQKAKVYCQLSRYEGLPNSLCEAMLCGCAPVGTCYCGIPTAIGNTGFYVPYSNVEATVVAIKAALNTCLKEADTRARIESRFTLERREKDLVFRINALVTVETKSLVKKSAHYWFSADLIRHAFNMNKKII